MVVCILIFQRGWHWSMDSKFDYDRALTYLLGKPEASEDFPFGPDVSVLKVKHKMFATISRHQEMANMNLKCDPFEAQMLRDVFPAVIPGYHMNKTHWNTVVLDGTVPAGEIERMIDNSYALVVKKLRKVERQVLETRYGEALLYPD